MDAGVVEGAIVMRDLATAVLARVESSLAQFDAKYRQVGSDVVKTSKTIADANKAMAHQFAENMRSAGEELTSIGKKLTIGITAPLTAAAVGVVHFARGFEKEMTTIETLVGVSREQVSEWKKDILAMSGEVGRAPEELAHAMFVVTSAGERGANALKILKESAKASAIGLGDTAVIARTVTAAMQAYGSSNLSAERATATLIATIQEGNLEADSLAGTLGRVIGIASQTGVSFQEVGAFIATFTRLGVDAAEATTGLRGILGTLLKPSQGAREQLHALGTSVDELRKNVKEKGLTQAMLDLANRVGDNADAIGEIIPNIRALSGFMGTAGAQGKTFAQIINTVNDAANNANFTNERFARTMETFGHKMEEVKAKLQAVAIQIGSRLLPVLGQIVDKGILPAVHALEMLTEMFTKLPTSVQNTVFAMLGFMAVLGPLTMLLGKMFVIMGGAGLAKGTGVLAKGLGELAAMTRYAGWEGFTVTLGGWMTKFTALATKVPLVGSAFALLTNPITLVVAAIAALTYAVYKFTGSWTTTFAILMPPIGLLMKAWQAFTAEWAKADGYFAPVKQVLSDLATIIGDKLSNAWDQLVDAWESTKETVAFLKKQIDALWVVMKDFGNWLSGEGANGWQEWASAALAASPTLQAIVIAYGLLTSEGKKATAGLHEQAEAIRKYRGVAAGKDVTLGVEWDAMARGATLAEQTVGGAFKTIATGATFTAASLDAVTIGAQAVGAASETGAVGVKSLTAQMAEAEAKIKTLTAEQRANIEAGFKLGKSEADIAQALNLSQTVIDLYKSKLNEAAKETKKVASVTQELTNKAKELTAVFEGFASLGAGGGTMMQEWVEQNADAILKLSANATAMKASVPAAFEAVVEAAKQVKIKEFVDAHNAAFVESNAAAAKKIMDKEHEKNKAIQEGIAQNLAMAIEYQNKLSDVQLSGTALRVVQIERERRAALNNVATFAKAHQITLEQATKAINAFYDHEVAVAEKSADTIVERMRAMGVETSSVLFQMAVDAINDFEAMKASGEYTAEQLANAFINANRAIAASNGQSADAMSAVAAGFQQMGQIAQGSMGSVLTAAGGIASGWAQAQQANIDWNGSASKGFGIANALFSKNSTSAQKWASGLQSAGAVVGGAMDTWAAATSTASKSMNTLKGAMAGAKAGAVFGPWGMAIGGVAGALAGLFGKGDQKRINDMRDEFVKNAGGIDKLNKAAADAGVSLDKLLKARSEKDLKKAMEEIQKAIEEVQKRVKTLVEDLGKLTVEGGLITKGLIERLKKDKNNPEVIAAFTDFLNSNIQRGIDGITAWIGIKKGIVERAVALMKEGTAASEAEAAKLNRIFGITGKAASAMGDALAGSYAAMIEAGMSATEAFAKLKDSILFVRGELQDANLPASESFQMLSDMALIAADSIGGPAIDSINALGSSLVGLANAGILNQGMFSGLTDQITTTFNALIAEGYNGEAAMNLIQPSLQKIWELQQQFGYETDEATQKLINQAVEAGKVGAAHMSAADRTAAAMERVASILERMATAMGITLPKAAQDGANGIERAYKGMDLRVKEPWADWGSPPEIPGGPIGDEYAKGGVIYAAEGWFKRRGTDTVPAMLTPGERVLTVQQNRDFETMLRAATSVSDARLRDYDGGAVAFSTGTGVRATSASAPSSATPIASAPAQAITFNIQALDPIGLKKVVETEVVPMLVSAYRRNVHGARTDTRKELVE